MKVRRIFIYSGILIALSIVAIILTMAIPINININFFNRQHSSLADLPSLDVIKMHGIEYMQNGNFEGAILEFNKSLNIAPSDTAYYNLGLCYFKLGDYKKSINEYKKALKLNPYYFDAYYNLGLVYGRLNDWFGSIITFEQLLSLKPNDIDAHYNLVLIGHIINNKKLIARHYKSLKILNPQIAMEIDEIKNLN